MASIGRGRGWARAANNETVLRRPGQPISPKKSELDEFIDKIYDLGIDETADDRRKEVVNFMKSYPDHESAENLGKLWTLSLDDRCFAIKFVKFYKFREYSKIDRDMRSQIHRYVLSSMQSNYEKREELQKENPLHLTNLTWMIGIHVRTDIKSTTIAGIMGQALLHCSSLLLDTATEDDTETVAIQLYLSGRFIEKHFGTGAPELSDIVYKARRILVNRNVSARLRALLLLIIDLANQGFEPLTGDLQAFYATVLEPSHTPEKLSRFLSGREFDTQTYLYQLLSEGMESKTNKNQSLAFQEVSKNKCQSQQPAQKANRTETTSGPVPRRLDRSGDLASNIDCKSSFIAENLVTLVPRAIRGSGASESSKDHRNEKKSPRGPKEKLTDEQVWSAKQNTGSKVWGHDDRFDNDYE